MSVEIDDQVHVGDVGTELVVAIVDDTGAVVNVAAASEMFIYLTGPDGVTAEVVAELDTDGTDGLIKYTTEPGDMYADGGWSIEGWVHIGDDEWTSLASNFDVLKARRYPNGDTR